MQHVLRTVCATIGAFLLAGVAAQQDADAAQGNINFGINIYQPNYCAIVVQNDGTLAADVSGHVLSSKEAGGVSGIATIYSLWSYDISVDAVPFFLAMPTGGDTGVTISSTFSGSAVNARGRTFAERPGNQPVRLRRGYSITQVTVDMAATRVGTPYPAGDYTALSIVRCE